MLGNFKCEGKKGGKNCKKILDVRLGLRCKMELPSTAFSQRSKIERCGIIKL